MSKKRKELPGDPVREMAVNLGEAHPKMMADLMTMAKDVDRVHETNMMLIAGQDAMRRQMANLSRQQTEGQMELAAKVITDSVQRMIGRYEDIRLAAARLIASMEPPGDVPTEVIDSDDAMRQLEAALVAFEAPRQEGKADGQ